MAEITRDFWERRKTSIEAADRILALVDAEKARVIENEPDNDILYDQRPDPLLVQAREALVDINRDFAMMFIASGGHKKANEAIAALDARLEAKA